MFCKLLQSYHQGKTEYAHATQIPLSEASLDVDGPAQAPLQQKRDRPNQIFLHVCEQEVRRHLPFQFSDEGRMLDLKPSSTVFLPCHRRDLSMIMRSSRIMLHLPSRSSCDILYQHRCHKLVEKRQCHLAQARSEPFAHGGVKENLFEDSHHRKGVYGLDGS